MTGWARADSGAGPVKRAVANLAAGVSLLLALAMPVLWVRSTRVADRLDGSLPGDRYLDVASVEGGVEVRFAWRHAWRERFQWSTYDAYRRTRGPWYAMGFAVRRDSITFLPLDDSGQSRVPPAPYWLVRVPYWFPLVVFAAYPLRHAAAGRRRTRERRRAERGLCVACGYDLRASRDVCPECGRGIVRGARG